MYKFFGNCFNCICSGKMPLKTTLELIRKKIEMGAGYSGNYTCFVSQPKAALPDYFIMIYTKLTALNIAIR